MTIAAVWTASGAFHELPSCRPLVLLVDAAVIVAVAVLFVMRFVDDLLGG
jgi:hypothetical protein